MKARLKSIEKLLAKIEPPKPKRKRRTKTDKLLARLNHADQLALLAACDELGRLKGKATRRQRMTELLPLLEANTRERIKQVITELGFEE